MAKTNATATPSISPTSAPDVVATIQLVPVKHLRESPFNPRKNYSQAVLQELAESIKAQGMLQPIVARPLPAGQQDIWVRHEIVFGHRRFRAAQLAGMDHVPVVLRAFTDHEAALAQVAENLQRQDVTALEEADSFVRLYATHGMTADQIAAGVNKSRSYVYGRLKLARMAPEVRTAMAEQDLPADIAIEVARFPDPVLQKKALVAVRQMMYGAEGWPSVRDAQRRLRGMFDRDTDEAPFDTADAGLAKLAGPCTTCPKRAGNDPDLQGVLDAGVCTDTSCFDGKTSEHYRIELVAMAAMGHKTLRNDDAEAFEKHARYGAPKGYTPLDDWSWAGDERVKYDSMLQELTQAGQAVPKSLAVHRKGWPAMREFITNEQAEQVHSAYQALVTGKAGGDDKGADTPSTAARARDGGGPFRFDRYDGMDRTGWTPAELVTIDCDAWERVKDAVLGNLARLPRTADDMRVILLREYDNWNDLGPMADAMGLEAECTAAEEAWEADDTQAEPFSQRAWWEAKLATMAPDTMAVLMLGAALWDTMGYGGRHLTRESAARHVALARRYGVDVVAAAQAQEVKDDAGCAGGRTASAGAGGEQLDAFGSVAA